MNWRMPVRALLVVTLSAACLPARRSAADPPTDPAPGAKKSSLVLVLKSGSRMSEDEVAAALKKAMKVSECSCANLDALKPVKIGQNEYETIKRFVDDPNL